MENDLHYRIDQKIYKNASDDDVKVLAETSEKLSDAVAEILGGLVLKRSNPDAGEDFQVFKFDLKLRMSELKTVGNQEVAALSAEYLNLISSQPGKKIKPYRLIWVIPTDPDAIMIEKLAVVSMIVWKDEK